jgi:hypothetical protein
MVQVEGFHGSGLMRMKHGCFSFRHAFRAHLACDGESTGIDGLS